MWLGKEKFRPELYNILHCRRIVLSDEKELEVFGVHLLSEDDHSHWAPPYIGI